MVSPVRLLRNSESEADLIVGNRRAVRYAIGHKASTLIQVENCLAELMQGNGYIKRQGAYLVGIVRFQLTPVVLMSTAITRRHISLMSTSVACATALPMA